MRQPGAPVPAVINDSGELMPANAGSARARTPRAGRRARIDTALFAESLAALLEAGLPVLDALHTLGQRAASPAMAALVAELDRSLREGLALSAALALHRDVFGDVIVALVQSAERTSNLGDSLGRYAADLRAQQAMRRRVLGSALYPAVVVSVGVLVIGFLLAYVVPRFAEMVLGSGVQVSPASRMLLTLSAAMHQSQGLTLAILLALAAAPALLFGTARGRAWAGAWLGRIPAWGRTVREYHLARFFSSAALLLRGGLPVLRTIELAADTLAGDDRVRIQGVLRRLSAGQDLAGALSAEGIDDHLVIRLVEVGQRSGTLGPQFQRVATLLELEVSRRIDWATRLFEPLLMLAIGVAIGTIVVLMYVPILELATAIE